MKVPGRESRLSRSLGVVRPQRLVAAQPCRPQDQELAVTGRKGGLVRQIHRVGHHRFDKRRKLEQRPERVVGQATRERCHELAALLIWLRVGDRRYPWFGRGAGLTRAGPSTGLRAGQDGHEDGHADERRQPERPQRICAHSPSPPVCYSVACPSANAAQPVAIDEIHWSGP